MHQRKYAPTQHSDTVLHETNQATCDVITEPYLLRESIKTAFASHRTPHIAAMHKRTPKTRGSNYGNYIDVGMHFKNSCYPISVLDI